MNTDNLKSMASKAVDSKNSLLSFLSANEKTADSPIGATWPEVFEKVSASKHQILNDDQLISWLYARHHGKELLPYLFGSEDVNAAKTNFQAARRHAFYVFVQPLSLGTLDATSYPGTYRYIDVAKLFSQNDTAKDRDLLARRVQTTAQMLMRLVYGNTSFLSWTPLATRSIATARVLGALHNERVAKKYLEGDRSLYNQGAAAWTLLTFSYFVADAWVNAAKKTTGGSWSYAFDDAAWYRFWAVVGSAMGIDMDLIPRNHAEAERLHQAFLASELVIPKGYAYGGDLGKIFATYDDKAQPTGKEFLGLLSWLPSYLLLQVPRMHNWVPFVAVGLVKQIGAVGSSIYSKVVKAKQE